MDNKIEYIGTGLNEDGKKINIYNYRFTTGTIKLGEDDGSKYCGINNHDSIVHLTAEQFKWNILKFAYKYDLNVPEDFHEFMKKLNPDYDTTLEELKEHWNDIPDLK